MTHLNDLSDDELRRRYEAAWNDCAHRGHHASAVAPAWEGPCDACINEAFPRGAA